MKQHQCPVCGGTGILNLDWAALLPIYQSILVALADGAWHGTDTLPMPATISYSNRSHRIARMVELGLIERLVPTMGGTQGYKYRLTPIGRDVLTGRPPLPDAGQVPAED